MALLWLTAAAAVEPPRTADDAAKQDVLVTVGGEPITRADLDAFERGRQFDRQPAPGPRQPLAAAALEQLVDERLLRAAIAAAGITVTPAQVQGAVDQLRGQLRAAGGTTLETAVETSGGSLASLERRLEFDLAVARLIGPRVDEAAIAAAFARHRRDIDGTRVHVSHVVLRPDFGSGDDALAAAFRKAADIRAAIVERRMSFGEAAARHSAGPSRHRGGDLGLLARRGGVHETFAREAFAVAVGEVSQPFATPFGVHIVTVTDVEPGRATLEQLRPLVERLAAQDAIRELVENLRRTTPISYSPGVPGPGRPAADGEPPAGGQGSPTRE